MKYSGTPAGMWLLFNRSSKKQLKDMFGLDDKSTSDAMLSAVVLSMPELPDPDRLIVYYRQSMMIPVMKKSAVTVDIRKEKENPVMCKA